MQDIEFMEEILDKRSRIEEMTDPKEKDAIKEENDKIMENYQNKISEAFEKKNYKEALALLERYKYYHRINEAISDWEDKHRYSH